MVVLCKGWLEGDGKGREINTWQEREEYCFAELTSSLLSYICCGDEKTKGGGGLSGAVTMLTAIRCLRDLSVRPF